ncbi:MAG: beta strand repeat-containing protein, partial [Dolichospermum sp.]
LSVTGTSNLANINANVANINTINATSINSSIINSTGNIEGGNLITAGNLSVAGQTILVNANVSGNVNAIGNVVAGNVLTGGLLSTSGNVEANIVNSNITNTTGNATVGNLITGGFVSATGLVRGNTVSAVSNITAGNVVAANNITVTSNLSVGNLANVGNLISTTNISAYGNVKSDIVNANTLIINANATLNSLLVSTSVKSNLIPNVDDTYYLGTPANSWHSVAVSNAGISIGQTSLTSNVNELTINAGNTIISSVVVSDLALGNYANLGDIGNLRIFGGNASDVLTTNGNGNVSFANILAVVPAAGSNTDIQFNDNGSFNGTSSLRFFKGNGVTSGTFAGNASRLFGIAGANVTGQVPNALVAGTVALAAQANITAVGNLTSLSVVGLVKAGNANLGNL